MRYTYQYGIIVSVALLIALHHCPAQTFTVFEPNADNFPSITAQFYALGSDGRPLHAIRKEHFTVWERGEEQRIDSIILPPDNTLIPISAVLTLDVSGSMSMESRLTFAQEAALDWIRSLPLDISECAITSFDDMSYVNQDFSQSPSHLMAAVRKMRPMNGTDYDKGFLDPITGALSIAKRGKNKRIVIFLTDGLGGGTERAIIDKARADSITIYCITLGMKMPTILRHVADSTGGAWFEHITTREELIAIYRRILFQAHRILPGTIIWSSRAGCTLHRSVTVRLSNPTPPNTFSTFASLSFTAPVSSLAHIIPTPRALTFRDVGVGNTQGYRVTLTATYQPVTILGIETNNPHFSIGGISNFPKQLNSGESITFTVGYVAQDSLPQVGRIDIRTNACAPVPIYVRSTYGHRTAAVFQHMAITSPTSDAVLYAGTDTVITWSGLMPSDYVSLEYSIDNGTTWKTIADQVQGLQYAWRVPPAPSEHPHRIPRMLVRARQVWVPHEVSAEPSVILDAHYGSLLSARFNRDGTKILTASADRTAKIFDAYTGHVLQSFEGHADVVSSASFSPDETKVLTTGYDNTIRLWNSEEGQLINTAFGRGLRKLFFDQAKMYGAEKLQFVNQDNQRFLDGAFSPDGTELVTTTDNGMAVIWKGTVLRPVSYISMFASGWMHSAAYSRSGKVLLTAGGDFSARIWTSYFSSVRHFIGHTDQVTHASFHPDETRVVTASADGTARIWDINTERQLMVLRHKSLVSSARYSPDGKRIVTASLDGYLRIWDAETGALQLTLPGDMGFHDADFSPDGSRVVGAGVDGTGRVWDIGGGFLQSAVSQPFIVLNPKAYARDIAMGEVLVGTAKDSVCTLIVNPDKAVVHVMDIRIRGAHAQDFALISGLPPLSIQASSVATVELRFSPRASGRRHATLEIITWTDTLRVRIEGTGLVQSFTLASPLDMGRVLLHRSTDTVITALRNTGTTSLYILSVRRASPDDSHFRLETDKRFPLDLDAGDSIVVRIRCTPTHIGLAQNAIQISIRGIHKPMLIPVVADAVAPHIHVNIALSFVDSTGTPYAPQSHDTVSIRSIRTVYMRPLLHYVFFDEHSSAIPPRYRLLTRAEAQRFPEILENNQSDAASVRYVRGIESYYNLLNIVGHTLAKDATLTARIIGSNSDSGVERGNIQLSRARAEALKQYLVSVWNIDEKRIKVYARNKPERASNSNDPDGAAENRRAEIVVEPQRALSPVSTEETLLFANPSVIRLLLSATSEEEIIEWSLDALATPNIQHSSHVQQLSRQRILSVFSGTGAPPLSYDYRFTHNDIRALDITPEISTLMHIQFRFRVVNRAGQTRIAYTPVIPVLIDQHQELRSTDSLQGHTQVQRFALSFFDFDKATLNQQNMHILTTIKTLITPNTEASIIGYTDRVGDAEYNKRLATERAKAVADILSSISPARKSVSGIGESVLLYDNDFPEGRLYCRTVEIILRKNFSTAQRSAP
ncbi:MAG: OmpA family protein [Bacteroidota bacterium]|nr:OmpA family protein [Candidatus Kapabacteria bacterium]MDW8220344.1 OmpA family protein [Bacteroidota bacterium]